MDVERTIQFLLDYQARVESQIEKANARMDRLDRRVDGVVTLVKTGMKMLVRMENVQKEQGRRLDLLVTKVDRLAEGQKATDKLIKTYFASLRNGRGKNGH